MGIRPSKLLSAALAIPIFRAAALFHAISAFPDAVRRIIYITNVFEAQNSKLRRAVRARGLFPNL
jgi:transposase-like protein